VTLIAPGQSTKLQSASAAITGWGAFSFVEAAVLLVAGGVLTLLFQRAEGRAFHLPGGDGGVITAAGLWTCALIVWRIFDKQGASTHGPSATSSGVEWGIFVALAAAAFLAYSGSRIRAAHRPEPPLPGEAAAPVGSNAAADTTEIPRRRERSVQSRRPARRPDPEAEPGRPAGNPLPDAAPVRPRRRVSAGELFERVIPEDPPAMRFGRIPPSTRPSIAPVPATPVSPSPVPTAPDQQLTIPFRDEETLVLGAEETLVLREDETLALGNDETLALGEDETLALGEDETLPLHPRRKR
jgi:hypothetical protein